jgi:hypothetical protein
LEVDRAAQTFLVIVGLTGSVALAQHGGGRGGGGQPGGGKSGPSQSAEEQQRAANAKQWGDEIEKVRAQAPPPPLPTIHFPTENEKLLGRLRWAEDPKKELAQYLEKLWKDAKQAPARKVALDGFWHDAEKPKWARAAIEDYYRKHAEGAELRAPPEPAELSKPATATPSAAAPASAPPATAPPATAPPATAPPATAPPSASAKPAAPAQR